MESDSRKSRCGRQRTKNLHSDQQTDIELQGKVLGLSKEKIRLENPHGLFMLQI